MSFDGQTSLKEMIDGMSEHSKLEFATYLISEMSMATKHKLIDVLRKGEGFVAIEVLTDLDLLEMGAEDARHMRNLMHSVRKDISDEPA